LNGIYNYSKFGIEKKERIIFDLCDIKDDDKLDLKELDLVVKNI
jgi:hypothetical protein